MTPQAPLSLALAQCQDALAGRRVLLIESNAPTRQHLARWLAFWGAKTTCAASLDGVPPLPEETIEFVVLDTVNPANTPERWRRLQSRNPQLAHVRLALSHQPNDPPLRADYDPGAILLQRPPRLRRLFQFLAGQSMEAAGTAEADASGDYSQVAVLVVEDNETNRLIAVRFLEKRFGVRPLTALNGQDAIDTLRRSHVDIIIMDCMMPELDGYRATQRIRQGAAGERHRLVPIIALTANAMPEDPEKCYRSGMNDYLCKPIEPDRIIEKFQDWAPAPPRRPDSDDSAAPTADQDRQTLDLNHLLSLYDNNWELIRETLAIFEDGLDESMSRLQQAAEPKQDPEKMRFYSHRISGSCAKFGARDLQRVADEIDERCQRQQFDQAHARLPEAVQAAERLKVRIAALLER